MAFGSWDVKITKGSAPQKVATAVSELGNALVGAKYELIAYLGSQVVNGVNHAVLVSQKVITGKDATNVALIIFNEKPELPEQPLTIIAIEHVVLDTSDKAGGVVVNVKEMDDAAKNAYNMTFAGYVGESVEPIMQLATQVANGTNYILLCKTEQMTLNGEPTVSTVTVNSNGCYAPVFADILKPKAEREMFAGAKAALKLSTPWSIYYNEVKALFEKDEQVRVMYNYEEPELKLWVKGNDEKAAALARFMPTAKYFGNVCLNISVVGDDGQPVPEINCDDHEAIKLAFNGNGAIAFTKDITTVFGDMITYLVFVKEIVQYFNDNITDLYGCKTTVYQDIAADIFEDTIGVNGTVFFSTTVE